MSGRVEVRPPWTFHLLWVGLLLIIATTLVRSDAYVYIDEAAVYAQVDVVDDGSWTVPRPLGAADDRQQWSPMNNSTVVGDRFAPFPNHPLHVLLASAAHDLGGRVGVRALSTFGVLAAAASAGLIASVVGRREAIAAVAITALASPLLFDAQLVVAHALAAPLAGALAYLAFVRPEASFLVRALGSAALAATGSLLRSEFVLFALAVAVVTIASAPERRRGSSLVVSLGAVIGAVGAYLLEPVWIGELVGQGIDPKVISSGSRGGATGRAESVLTVLVDTGSAGAVPLVLAVVLSAVAVAIARWRPTAMPVAAVAAAAASAMAVAKLFAPAVVPGIVWAFPMLTVGLLIVRRAQLVGLASQALLACGLFAVAVLILQYRDAGGFEWGWRYVHIAVPVLVAALAAPVVSFLDSARTLEQRIVVAGVAAVALLVPVSGVLQQRRHVDATAELLSSVDAAMERTDAELIVSTEPLFGRYVWQQSVAGRVATTDRQDSSGLLAAAEEGGFDRVLLVWAGDQPAPALSGYSPASEVVPLPGPFRAQLLTV